MTILVAFMHESNNMKALMEQWNTISILRTGFQEHLKCARTVYAVANEILQCDADVKECYQVTLGKIPEELFTMRRNLFSALFQSVYQLVGISPERRHLYGQINFLNRIWVTSADNLLDNEDKITLPVELGEKSHVMGNVVALMAADRILTDILLYAVESGSLTATQAHALSRGTLQTLLPSAAQEASEEMGIEKRPASDVVLNSIHHYKTGVLFNIPFVAPNLIEKDGDWNAKKASRINKALLDFGLGCQLLDDIRDLARDLVEKRNNYLLSLLAEESPEVLEKWHEQSHSIGDRLYREVPEWAQVVSKMARKYFISSTESLAQEGLPLYTAKGQKVLISVLYKLLDLQELTHE